MNKNDKIFVAGHKGLVGSSTVQALQKSGYKNIITKTRNQLDLLNQNDVNTFFQKEQVDIVVLAAAKVGGIHANRIQQTEFLYENLTISANVIMASHNMGVKKLLFLGSGCIYPKNAPQPIREDFLLLSPLEPTNEGYAIAKIAGLKLCEHINLQYNKPFISAMPCNLYGPNDNFHPDFSHVVPGLLRRFHLAKINDQTQVKVWGTGLAKREFLFVEDVGTSIVTLLENYNEPETINIGCGQDIEISALADLIKHVVGYKGDIIYDKSMPDGTMRKLLDISKIRSLGWTPKTDLETGLRRTYQWVLDNDIFK